MDKACSRMYRSTQFKWKSTLFEWKYFGVLFEEDSVFDLFKILEVIKTKRRICLSIWKIYSLSLVNNVSALALITADFWCSLVEAKGTLISMELLLLFFVSNHNFACTKEHHRLAQLGSS